MKMSASSSPQEEECSQDGSPLGTGKKYPDYCRTISFTDNNGVVRELVFPKALDLDRPKRARTTFSREQLDRLEAEFTGNQYLVGRERSQLARNLGLSETQVKVWFQNRRTKHKRDKEKFAEHQESKAESAATQSLLHFLQPPGAGHTGCLIPSEATPPSSATSTSSSSSCSARNDNSINSLAPPCQSPRTSIHPQHHRPQRLTDQRQPGKLPGFAAAAVTDLMPAPLASFSTAAVPVHLHQQDHLAARTKLEVRDAAAALRSSSLNSPLTDFSIEAVCGRPGALRPESISGSQLATVDGTNVITTTTTTGHSVPAAASSTRALLSTTPSMLPHALHNSITSTSALRFASSASPSAAAVASSIASGIPPPSLVGVSVLPNDLARAFVLPGRGEGGRRGEGFAGAAPSCGPMAGYHHPHHHGGVPSFSNAAAWLVDPFSVAAACHSAQGTLGAGAAALHARFPSAAWPVYPHHHVSQSLQ